MGGVGWGWGVEPMGGWEGGQGAPRGWGVRLCPKIDDWDAFGYNSFWKTCDLPLVTALFWKSVLKEPNP